MPNFYRFISRLFSPAMLMMMVACASIPADASRLPPDFMQALQKAGVPAAALSIQVQAVDSDKVLLSHNAGLVFKPASIMKLLTTQAALDLLGPYYRWNTRVYVDGELTGDVLRGDLIIKGSGDPRLAQEDLWRMLRRLRAMGIREIKGSLVLDRSLFQLAPLDPHKFDGQAERAYNATPDALLLDAKAFNLLLVPDKTNQRVQVASEPLLAGFNVIPPQLVSGECGDWRSRLALVFEPFGLRFKGSYAASCGEQRYAIHALNLTHAQYFDAGFRQIWAELGGSISGPMREGAVPATAREVLQWNSAALADTIRDINKFSNNVMARQLLLTIAAERGNVPATIEAASAQVQGWLSAKEIPAAGFVLDNGSGLSRNERISALTLARVLQLAWRSPTMPEFVASMPIAGIDGTMSRRVQAMGVKAQAHIKTGSLNDVISMAGYVTAKSGKRLLIVCMVNHQNANDLRGALDLLLQWVYEQG